MSKCVHCDKDLGEHRTSASPINPNACPVPSRPDRGNVWHPSNRFTPALWEEIKPLLCWCGKPGQLWPSKGGEIALCDLHISLGEHEDPVFVMTGKVPYPTGKEALQAGGSTSVPVCPPGCAPFDLAKALAGERLVTREGGDMDRFHSDSAGIYWALNAMDRYCQYSETGNPVGWGSAKNDLFLAAKEEEKPVIPSLGRVGDHSSVDDGEFEIPTSNREQTELDRQIEVMRASKGAGAILEAKAKEETVWVVCKYRPSWNWECFDYRIRPEPAPPRRVFCVFQTDGEPAHFQGFSCAPLPVGWTESEFIELDARVRSACEKEGIKL